jgi:DNA-directed RNA polymerase III subunit RPC6
MLYDLEPSGELSGGPWYDDNKELDVAFVTGLLDVVHRYIHKHSFPPPAKVQTAEGMKRLPRFYKPGYKGYPTAEQIYDWILEGKILDDSVKDSFGISHVHKLLEVLCYQNVIAKRSDGNTYRAILSDDDVRPEEQDEYYDDELFEQDQADALFGHKGYTEAPCGRCPVFDRCGEPGEAISAATCTYWNEWTNRIIPSELF